MNGWLPIESAPKDSRARLVWCPRYSNTYLVSWGEEGWAHFGGSGGWLHDKATHWMPLPEPPDATP